MALRHVRLPRLGDKLDGIPSNKAKKIIKAEKKDAKDEFIIKKAAKKN